MDSDIRWRRSELITNYNNQDKKIKDKHKRYPAPQRPMDKTQIV